MNRYPPKQAQEFLRQSSLGLAVVGLVLTTPFAINNFLQGQYLLGMGGLLINGIFAFNTWTITKRNYYSDTLTLMVLVPIVIFFLNLTFIKQGMIGVFWCYPSVISCYCMLPERKAWIANIALLTITLPNAWHILEQALAIRMVATLLMVSIFSAIFVRVINEQQQKLKLQVITDPLTGLLSRTSLQETLEQAIAQSKRMGIAMTLASLDIDHFKSVNDIFGHAAGDQVLRDISLLLTERLRRVDRVFRIGGEEFLLRLYGTNTENGYIVAEELRHLIGAKQLLPNRSVTVSIGVATLQPEEDWMTWRQRSDDHLYRAKSTGRNRVVCT